MLLYFHHSNLTQNVSVCAQSCLTLCDPMDCSLPGSSIHRIFQARILEWVAISFSRGSSRPSDQTWVSCTAGRFFTKWVISQCKIKSLKKETSLMALVQRLVPTVPSCILFPTLFHGHGARTSFVYNQRSEGKKQDRQKQILFP